jgi:hypothetical protein
MFKSKSRSDTDKFDDADLRKAIKQEIEYHGDPTMLTIYKWDATNKHKVGEPIVDCDDLVSDFSSKFAYELPSSAVSSHDTSLNDSDDSKAEALSLIDRTTMHQLELTPTIMKFSGRDEVMAKVEEELKKIRQHSSQPKAKRQKAEKKKKREKKDTSSDGKGQPIIATGATTGIGKSRLLEEVRLKYKKLDYEVVVLSYNSGANLAPHAIETNCSNLKEVENAFFSRLLCMMLPTKEFEQSKSSIHTRFTVTYAQVLDIISTKFAGKNMLILMDEVGTLGQVLMPDGSRS